MCGCIQHVQISRSLVALSSVFLSTPSNDFRTLCTLTLPSTSPSLAHTKMPPSKSVFLIGPGLIGWSVLDLLVADGYSVTGLVRRKEHGEGIQASGATPLYGDLNDAALITQQTAEHDLTIHTATADHLPSVLAVLEGLKQRASKGLETVFIHTSGTSVLDDGSKGMFKSEKVYHDDRPEDIDALPDDAPHRPIDLAIVKAKKDLGEKAKIAIMIPPLIYGSKSRLLSTALATFLTFSPKVDAGGYGAE